MKRCSRVKESRSALPAVALAKEGRSGGVKELSNFGVKELRGVSFGEGRAGCRRTVDISLVDGSGIQSRFKI